MDTYRLKGLIAATFTPFNEDGSVNTEQIPAYVDYLIKSGVTQVFVNGTTGEGMSLTSAERKLLAEHWVKCGKGRLTAVMVHVGCANLGDSVELAKHAAEIGAHAISAVPPFFFRPSSVEALVDYCRRVAEAAPELPFYLYHIPQITGVDLDIAAFLTSAREVIPSLRGVKYSSKDLVMASQLTSVTDRNNQPYNILYGCDEQLAGALLFGVDGAVGTTYNFMAPLYRRVEASLQAGRVEEAARHQRHSQNLVSLIFKSSAMACGSTVGPLKEVMAQASGVSLGPLRPPLLPLTPQMKEGIRHVLQEVAFHDWRW